MSFGSEGFGGAGGATTSLNPHAALQDALEGLLDALEGMDPEDFKDIAHVQRALDVVWAAEEALDAYRAERERE